MAIRNLNGTIVNDWIDASLLAAGVSAVSWLGTGDDGFNGSAGSDLAYAEAGNDVLLGNTGNDTLYGGEGQDQIYGGIGNDSLDGGDGNDLLDGGAGKDTLLGGAGDDQLYGREGNDSLAAGEGNNLVDGGLGNDNITAGAGADVISGGDGNDTINAGGGNNVAYAGIGDDRVTTGAGDDVIAADDGNDTISAGSGNNIVYAGAGNDRITTGAGNDVIAGEDGNDIINAGDGNNIVYAGVDNDQVTAGSGDDIVAGEGGDDTINAGAGNNIVYAGVGHDRVITGAGNDVIVGEDGNDTINAGAGNNLVYAGAGNDQVITGSGSDIITGDGGNDMISAGAGNDVIYGGDGNDELNGGRGLDQVFGDGGDDLVVQARSEGDVQLDQLYGGAGFDTLGFTFSRSEWLNGANQAELARLLVENGSPAGQAGAAVVSNLYGLTFAQFEAISVLVDGTVLTAQDDPVTALNDLFTVTAGGGVTGSLVANDLVPDLVASVTRVGPAPTPGTFSLSTAGLMNFDTGSAFASLAQGHIQNLNFTYRVRDADGDQATAVATIRVIGENDAPTATDQTAAVTENSADSIASGSLLAGAGDPDLTDQLGVLSVAGETDGSVAGIYGTLVWNAATGAFTYTLDNADPDTDALAAGAVVQDVFGFILGDGHGGSATAALTVQVTGAADAPPPGLDGHLLRYEYFYPSFASVIDTRVFAAEAGQSMGPHRFPDWWDVIVHDSALELRFEANLYFSGQPFAAIRFGDAGGDLSPIQGVSVAATNLAGIDNGDVGFDGDHVWINFGGVDTNAASYILLDLVF